MCAAEEAKRVPKLLPRLSRKAARRPIVSERNGLQRAGSSPPGRMWSGADDGVRGWSGRVRQSCDEGFCSTTN